MRTCILAASLFAALTLGASAETRDVDEFYGVSAADRIRVEINVGEGHVVDVTGDDADRVRTEVRNGRLEIRRAGRSWFGGNPRLDAVVRITMPGISSLSASRGAEVNAEGVNSRNISLAAAMGGELRVAGRCTNVSASASMGGAIDARALQCAEADASASMGGAVRVAASSRFDASASMGGAINLSGAEARGDVSTSMGGSFQQD